jgi:hypothetical protein
MDRSAVLAKTAKGLEEVGTRAHGLQQRLRSLLIMVDGTATAGDLIAKFSGIADVETSLEALVTQGFVTIKATQAGAPKQSGPASVTETRAQALAKLTRLLHDAIGPDADSLALSLENARNRAEFLAAAERCADTLAVLTNPAGAQQFRDRAQAYAQLLPGT